MLSAQGPRHTVTITEKSSLQIAYVSIGIYAVTLSFDNICDLVSLF